ncbi:carotenoid oxygenase [Azospirillum sp. RWY-5-1]|uniref:Dioxygenase n=1 Tax=Azospirillum oleiclasticum TaxID=2735135 RepID=A0ABX2TKA4_9PROT|nr:carotenoid oxygenase family protein [Azospirillum oleiclasticum]NYZ16279.1 carotenoid oxygenase [Azospirillum oleiclasticum]NYZ23766.1 carotenoid oxygenase [Azospirillum oleiclasticum]
MQRRAFLTASAGALAAATLPHATALADTRPAPPDDWAAAFDAALADDPWLLGWKGDGVERDAPPLTVTGRIPAGLAGSLYRNGPARQVVGGQRYHHWFDGDGMVHRWGLSAEGVTYRGRFVRTRKFVAEERAGRPLVPAFGTVPDGVPPVVAAGGMNVANTSVLPLGGRLLALWEGGAPYALDPLTLDTAGEHAFRPDLAGLPFSAHPKVEPDGTVWNFGSNFEDGRLLVWRLGPDGTMRDLTFLAERFRGMLHDFAVTERHLVFVLPPLTIEPSAWGRGSFLDAHRWDGAAPTRVVAVDKADLARQRVWELPAGFGFHTGNAWEEADGTIRFDVAWAADARIVLHGFRAIMRGDRLDVPPPRATLVTLRPDGRVETALLGPEAAEFPRVDPRVVGRRNRALFHLVHPGTSPGLTAVVRRDLESGAEDRFDYGSMTAAEEHVFVPRPGSAVEGDGWLVGTVLDVAKRRTGLSVLDARRPSDGPLAQAWLDSALPLGFHGAFVAA